MKVSTDDSQVGIAGWRHTRKTQPNHEPNSLL